jgi:hypothetical protein
MAAGERRSRNAIEQLSTRRRNYNARPMTPTQFRRIVLGLPDVVEASHMSHPDFRAANGRIFATLNENETRGMASLTPEQQADFLARAPKTFIPAAGAWGRGGSTMIELKSADAEIVGEAVTMAWQRISTMPAAKKRKTK